MDEEFQARMNICGEKWWSIDSARSVFPPLSTSSSPCSVAAAAANDSSTRRQIDDDIIGNLKETSTRSCADSAGCYLGCFDVQKLHKSTESASGSGSSSILMDSTLQMMGFALTSSTSANWNHPLFRCNGRPAENNFHNSVLQQELAGIDSPNSQQIQRDYWNPKSFPNQVSTLKPMNQDLINLLDDQQSSLTFPIRATSYGTTFPSTLSHLYDPDIPQPQPQQHTLFTNRSLSHSSSKANYGTSSSNELSPIWSKVSTFVKPPPIAKQHPTGGLHFSNNTPFWNASADALHDMKAGSFASSQSQYQTPSFEEKPNFTNTLLNKVQLKSEETLDSASMAKKIDCEPALKRPRIETPSTLPTFKVRKEKLGDRVTALQQLVSPFGKTDTASVLHEAIEYIKFLHDQVSVLSTPYMKNGSTIQQQQGCDDMKDCKREGPKQDLRSRGLCLVPISSTFPVATETTTSADHLYMDAYTRRRTPKVAREDI